MYIIVVIDLFVIFFMFFVKFGIIFLRYMCGNFCVFFMRYVIMCGLGFSVIIELFLGKNLKLVLVFVLIFRILFCMLFRDCFMSVNIVFLWFFMVLL